MKNYMLDVDDMGLCLFEYDKELETYVKLENITIDKLFSILDTMIKSKNNIEEMHLQDNVLKIKAIYFFEKYLYKEETIYLKINNKILNNREFRLALYKRLNIYNADYKTETNDTIGNLKFNPENIRKRRLMNIS